MDNRTDLNFLFRTLKRRKKYLILPFVIIYITIAAITFLLPPVYRSDATILIEAQNVPERYVHTTVTGYVEERLQTISQVVLSRVSLEGIIERLGLYQEEIAETPIEELVQKMRRDIVLEPIHASIVHPQSGRATTATVAFSISYKGRDPEKVAEVTSELVELFLAENLRNREQKTRRAVEFLEAQAKEVRSQIYEKEKAIAEFKQSNLTALPELVNMNMQMAERLEKDIQINEEQLRTLQNRKVYLEGQLATIDPGLYGIDTHGQRLLSPSLELQSLRREYASMRAHLSEDHPDVRRIKSRLSSMEQTYGSGESLPEVYRILNAREERLEELKQRYAEAHPDVVALNREIASLKERAETLEKKGAARTIVEQQPENPAYINIKTQITSTDMEIERFRTTNAQLSARLEDYRRRLELTPGVEQEFRLLKLDYDNAQQKYVETMSRLQSAREAMVLEESDLAEKMTLISPATIPETPYSPNRLLLLFVGLVVAFGGSVGVTTLSELMDNAVHGVEDLEHLTSKPILAGIPYLTTRKERSKKRRRKMLFVALPILGLAIIFAVIHYYITPLSFLF
jgi:polysaccharide biosynthesis transport protein